MLERHGELHPHVRMAAIAEGELRRPRQQKLRRMRFMDGMTVCADHARQRVRGAADVGARQRLAVALETSVEYALRRKLRKSNDGRLTAVRGHMLLPWSVATLAAGAVGRLCAGRDALEMRILVKVEPHVGMTGLAHIAADVLIGGVGVVRGGQTCVQQWQEEDDPAACEGHRVPIMGFIVTKKEAVAGRPQLSLLVHALRAERRAWLPFDCVVR